MEASLQEKYRAEYLRIERISKGDSDIFTKLLIIRNYIEQMNKELNILGSYPEGDTIRFLISLAEELKTNLTKK